MTCVLGIGCFLGGFALGGVFGVFTMALVTAGSESKKTNRPYEREESEDWST